jgi:predicted dehydrogenase
MKSRKIVIIGLGSIGKRHLENIISLGYKDIVLIRPNGEQLVGYENLEVFKTIDEGCLKYSFEIAVIATPTSNHIKTFKALFKFNVNNIYLEKPISNEYNEYNEILKQIEIKKINVTVGYDLHFEPGLMKIKKILSTGYIGEIVSFISEVGQFLPDWRPAIDYRDSMSARKIDGGGVMLDLVHEFDYINWLLGPFISIVGMHGKLSNLEIETEDISVNILKAESGVIGTLHLDYLQKKLSRKCKIIGNNGIIIWDYSKAMLKWKINDKEDWEYFNYSTFSRNDRFINIMKLFLDSSYESRDKRLTTFKDALKSLKMVALAKQSNKNDMVELL